MSRLARVAAVVAFALAYLSQPLALDACAMSCEAARAARGAAVAAPCHHTTSCATQISQSPAPGSTAATQAQHAPPPVIALVVDRPAASPVRSPSYCCVTSSSPPTSTQLRV